MADDFNNFNGGSSIFQHMSLILFFSKGMPKGEIVGIIYCHNLRQNCATCLCCLTEVIRTRLEGCNMHCLKVGARVGRPN